VLKKRASAGDDRLRHGWRVVPNLARGMVADRSRSALGGGHTLIRLQEEFAFLPSCSTHSAGA